MKWISKSGGTSEPPEGTHLYLSPGVDGRDGRKASAVWRAVCGAPGNDEAVFTPDRLSHRTLSGFYDTTGTGGRWIRPCEECREVISTGAITDEKFHDFYSWHDDMAMARRVRELREQIVDGEREEWVPNVD